MPEISLELLTKIVEILSYPKFLSSWLSVETIETHQAIQNQIDSTRQALCQYLGKSEYDLLKDHRELEHQIGRYDNFSRILSSFSTSPVVIEFGVWRGDSLLFFLELCSRYGLLDSKIIGVAAFKGLPATEGMYYQGQFSDTSYEFVVDRISKFGASRLLLSKCKIGKFWFKEKDPILSFLTVNEITKIDIVHFDCDISTSVNEIFEILFQGQLLADNPFLIFDDWASNLEYQARAVDWLSKLESQYNVNVFNETNISKTFKLTLKE